jgi:RNA polymerase primary sigma factor
VSQTTRLSTEAHFLRGGQIPPLAPSVSDYSGNGAAVDVSDSALEDVLAHARAQGYLTLDELAIATSSEPEKVDEIASQLSALSIPVVEIVEGGALVEVDPQESAIEPVAERINDDLSGVSLDDPVRIYLREIGRVPLLNTDQEVSLSQVMEARDYLIRIYGELAEGNGGEPSAYTVGMRIYQSFVEGWPLVYDFYCTAFPDHPAKSKQQVLQDVLPLSSFQESMVEGVCNRYEITTADLEDALRQRRIEYPLLPPEMQGRWLHDVLTGRKIEPARQLALRSLLSDAPVALLSSDSIERA